MMYKFNVYRDFGHGEFKYLDTIYVTASSREIASSLALAEAKHKYGNCVSLISSN